MGSNPAGAAPASPGLPPFIRIPLHARSGDIKGYALVSAEDADKVQDHRWHMNTDGYAVRNIPIDNGKQRIVSMARTVLGLEYGDRREADHISRDKLDNRRSNLRIVTHAQNMQNQGSRKGYSRYRGVSFNKEKRKWTAYCQVDGKMNYLGAYDTEEQAASVAAEWRREHLDYATS